MLIKLLFQIYPRITEPTPYGSQPCHRNDPQCRSTLLLGVLTGHQIVWTFRWYAITDVYNPDIVHNPDIILL